MIEIDSDQRTFATPYSVTAEFGEFSRMVNFIEAFLVPEEIAFQVNVDSEYRFHVTYLSLNRV